MDAIEEALKVILEELRKISTELVSEKELTKAKEYLKGRTTLYLEDNQSRLDWYLEQSAFKKIIKTPADVYKEIDSVTAKQLLTVAKDLFQKNKIQIF
mgnify:FL=1